MPLPDPTNFRARRRAEIEAEKLLQKEKSSAILKNEKIKTNVVKQVKRLQAICRGKLCREKLVIRHVLEHNLSEQWKLENVFTFYADRQSETETKKERIFQDCKKHCNKWIPLYRSADTLGILRNYVKESDLNYKLSALTELEELKQNCCKKVIREAIETCKIVNVDFQRLYDESLNGLSTKKHFVYFSKAISLGYFVIMLRDFKLLTNAITHGEVARLFKKYGVKIDEEREKVRAVFTYRHISKICNNIFTPRDVSDAMMNLGCNYDTKEEVSQLLNGETYLSERAFIKFWQKHIGDNLLIAKEVTDQTVLKPSKGKPKNASLALQIGLRFAGFKSILVALLPNVYPQESSCRCRACRKLSLPPRTTAQEVHAKFVLQRVLRYHIATAIHLVEESSIDGGYTLIGRNILNFNDHFRWWLRYENSLKSLFVFYASEAWDLSIGARKTFDDVVHNDVRLSYTNFLRFAIDFGIFPTYIGNDKSSQFALLLTFLSAFQGTRSEPFHNCQFSSSVTVGEGATKRSNMSSKYCVFCGEPKNILSLYTEEKLQSEFNLFSNENGEIYLSDIPELLRHAGENVLEAQLYFVQNILQLLSSSSGTYIASKKDEVTGDLVKTQKDNVPLISFPDFMFAIEQSRRLREQILTGQLTFPEFLHALSLVATKCFSYDKMPHEWRNPMQEIFKIMDPTFRTKFGRSIESEIEQNLQKDPLIDTVKKNFRSILSTLYDKYKFLEDGIVAQDMSSDAFVLFVQDCRILKHITYEQAINMFKATLKSTKLEKMSFNQFADAIDGLLFENFCSQKPQPAPISYFEPVGPGTGITNEGLALRQALAKLALLYEQYNPLGRSTASKASQLMLSGKKHSGKMSPSSAPKNESGKYLRLSKTSRKMQGGGNLAKSRLKRAIRQKTDNLMKLSRIGFGTKARRDVRSSQVAKMIWDVSAEEGRQIEETESIKETFINDKYAHVRNSKVKNKLYKPSAPPESKTMSLRPSSLRKRRGQVFSLRKKNDYMSIWTTAATDLNSIVGRSNLEEVSIPKLGRSLSTTMKMEMLLSSLGRTTHKNVSSVKSMATKIRNMAGSTSGNLLGETRLNTLCSMSYMDGFGHLTLDSCMRVEGLLNERDNDIAELFFTAQEMLQNGNSEGSKQKLQIALGHSINLITESGELKTGTASATSHENGQGLLHSFADDNVYMAALRAKRASHIYQALAFVCEHSGDLSGAEAYRIQQIHFAKTAGAHTRGYLHLLALEALGLYFANHGKYEDAIKQLKLCENEFHHLGDKSHLRGNVLFELATVYNEISKTEEAIHSLEAFLSFMQEMKNYPAQSIGLRLMGDIYMKNGANDYAIAKWREALAYQPRDSVERTSMIECIAAALKTMKRYDEAALEYSKIVMLQTEKTAKCHYIYLQAGAYKDFLHSQASKEGEKTKGKHSRSYKRAVRLYMQFIQFRSECDQTLGPSDDIIAAYLRLGDVYSFFGYEFKNATEAYRRAENLCLAQNGQHGSVLLSQALYKLGCTFVLMENRVEAEKILKRALLSSLDSNQLDLTCNIYKHLGRLKIQANKCKEARNYLQRCIIICSEKSQQMEGMGASFDLGMCLLKIFDDDGEPYGPNNDVLEEAAKLFEGQLALAKVSNNLKRQAQALCGLAECKRRMLENENAVDAYTQCIAIQTKIGDTVGEMETYNALGNLHLAMGKLTLAKAAIHRELKLAQINEDDEVIETAGIMLSSIYHNIFDATQVDM
jgi:tetratricopeptide (TPR) repeat protein